MTNATRVFPTAILALLLIRAAPKAYAADGNMAASASVPTNPPVSSGALVSAVVVPSQPAGLALLPAHRSVEEIAAATSAETRDGAGRRVWRHRWQVSLAPLVASQSLDAASSWGLREMNPVLAGPDGRFGSRATAVKFGVTGALIGAEYLLLKKFPGSAKFFTVVNYTTAGITTGLAVHNYRLPGR